MSPAFPEVFKNDVFVANFQRERNLETDRALRIHGIEWNYYHSKAELYHLAGLKMMHRVGSAALLLADHFIP